MKLINADNFSNEFNSKIFNKLQNEYLNSTADDKTKDVADFVVTDIMTTFNDLIDNAPTVKLEYLPNYAGCQSVEMVRVSRPQGEWITVKQDTILGTFEVNNKVCDQCNHATKYEYPFCPWCGADMRGNKE